jgi:hypothetical protein
MSMSSTPAITAIGLVALLATTGCSSEDSDFNLPACYASDNCGPDEGSGSTGSGQDPQTQAGMCEVASTWVAPTAIFLLDQSGSMSASFGTEGGVSRWNAMYDSLFDPVEGVAGKMSSSVQLGLSLYTNVDGEGACPRLTEVAPSTDITQMEQTFAANEPLSETPTGESIMAVASALEAAGTPGPKHIILATDGVPDTCAQPNPNEGEPVALDGARQAYDKGVTTHVIGIGLDVATSHLQDMANAGAGQPATGSVNYYQALEPSILTERFDYILSQLRSCSFVLDTAVSGAATVTLDGTELTQGGENGWSLASPNEIELRGGACDLHANGSQLVVSAACAVPTD